MDSEPEHDFRVHRALRSYTPRFHFTIKILIVIDISVGIIIKYEIGIKKLELFIEQIK